MVDPRKAREVVRDASKKEASDEVVVESRKFRIDPAQSVHRRDDTCDRSGAVPVDVTHRVQMLREAMNGRSVAAEHGPEVRADLV